MQKELTVLLRSLTGDVEHDKEVALTKLDSASERIRGLKRKLDDLQPNLTPTSQSNVMRERIAYVEDVLLGSRLSRKDNAKAPPDVAYATVKKESEEDRLEVPVPETTVSSFLMETEEMERKPSITSELEKISGNSTPTTPAKPMDG